MDDVGDLYMWAIGYPDPARARAVRAELLDRVESRHGLHVLDAIVVTRGAGGEFELTRDEKLPVHTGALGLGFFGLLVGSVVLQPVAVAAAAAAAGGLAAWVDRRIVLDPGFAAAARELVAPGTSALFLLTRTADPDAVTHRLRGLGGAVLKTSVGPELARLVQDSLDAPATPRG